MPGTTLQDVIVPELFNPYVISRTMELSALFNSGIVTTDAAFNALAGNPSPLVNMPFWNDLSGESETVSEGTSLAAKKITTSKDVAVLRQQAAMWSATDLSGALAGDDPMATIGTLVAQFWARDMEKDLIALLKGVFGTYNSATGGTKGVYTITISTKGISGDKITVDGVDYTLDTGTSVANHTLAVGTTATTQAGELKTVLEDQYGDTFTITQTAGVVTLTQAIAGEGAVPVVSVTQTTSGTLAAAAATTTAGVANAVTRMASNRLDITGMTASTWSASAFIDAQQLLGDAKSQLTAVVMHSATEAALRKADLITTEKSSTALDGVGTYMGKRVIVDDNCPVSGTGADRVYKTYLFGSGAIAYGVGNPVDFVPTELDRDKQKGSGVNYLINRRAYIMHPRGVAYQKAVQAGTFPTRLEIANAQNWNPVWEPKQLRIVEFCHKL